MTISHNRYDAIESLIFNEGLRIQSLEFSPANDKIFILLNNNLVFVTHVNNYKGLKNATLKRLKNFKLIGSGTGIHWPDLDEDLSLKGFLQDEIRKIVKNDGIAA